MGLREKLRGKRVYFDANIFIYLMEGLPAFQAQMAEIRACLLNDKTDFVTSELTLCEVLVLPFRQNDTQLVAQYRQLIEDSGAFDLLATNRETYIRASLYRAQFRMKTPDAVHMASAVEAGCTVFVTADRGMKGPKGMEILGLGE